MARVDQLPERVRVDIAEQIGERLPEPAPGLGAESALTLGFSLPISLLIPTPEPGLTPSQQWVIEATGLWHHQIQQAGGAVAFARTQPAPQQDESRQEVQEIVEADSAARIAETVAWIDTQEADVIPEETRVRLLIAPSLYLTAILLQFREALGFVVVDRPRRLAMLEAQRVYTAVEFFTAISEVGPLGLPVSR